MYVRGGTDKRSYAFKKKTVDTNLVLFWCNSQFSQLARPNQKIKIAPKNWQIVPSTLLQTPVRSLLDSQSLILQKIPILIYSKCR